MFLFQHVDWKWCFPVHWTTYSKPTLTGKKQFQFCTFCKLMLVRTFIQTPFVSWEKDGIPISSGILIYFILALMARVVVDRWWGFCNSQLVLGTFFLLSFYTCTCKLLKMISTKIIIYWPLECSSKYIVFLFDKKSGIKVAT